MGQGACADLARGVGGYEFGPHGDELEAHADAVMRRIAPRCGEYAVYARTALDGAPDLDGQLHPARPRGSPDPIAKADVDAAAVDHDALYPGT